MPVVTCKVSTSTVQSVDARANILAAPVALGPSSKGDDGGDDDNDNNNESRDTHMLGADSGDHAPRLSRSFHAPIGSHVLMQSQIQMRHHCCYHHQMKMTSKKVTPKTTPKATFKTAPKATPTTTPRTPTPTWLPRIQATTLLASVGFHAPIGKDSADMTAVSKGLPPPRGSPSEDHDEDGTYHHPRRRWMVSKN